MSEKKRIGYALCGSFCTLSRSLSVMGGLRDEFDIVPIISPAVRDTDTRFGRAEDFSRKIKEICRSEIITDIVSAEPLGPKEPLDALIIAPCTGNTLSKLSHGITDTAVTMAAKAHLRGDKPLLIALATNDAMSQNLKSLSTLLMRKSVYFVPMLQDEPRKKPHSLVADFERIPECLEAAFSGIQKRPLFL